jgi:hypothetical protein
MSFRPTQEKVEEKSEIPSEEKPAKTKDVKEKLS